MVLVENKRLDGGGVVQRHVLYLGEINSSPGGGVAQGDRGVRRGRGLSSRTLALFPEDRCEVAVDDASVVAAKNFGNAPASSATVGRLLVGGPVAARSCNSTVPGRGAPAREPEANALGSSSASAGRLPTDRTRQRLAAASRNRFGKSAMADLLGADFGLAETHKLYACHDPCCSPTRTRCSRI